MLPLLCKCITSLRFFANTFSNCSDILIFVFADSILNSTAFEEDPDSNSNVFDEPKPVENIEHCERKDII